MHFDNGKTQSLDQLKDKITKLELGITNVKNDHARLARILIPVIERDPELAELIEQNAKLPQLESSKKSYKESEIMSDEQKLARIAM